MGVVRFGNTIKSSLYSKDCETPTPPHSTQLQPNLPPTPPQRNTLEGSVPSELGRMSGLKNQFRLQSNLLCGLVPTQLAALSASNNIGNAVTNWDVTTATHVGPTVCEATSALSALYAATLGTTTSAWTTREGWMTSDPCSNGWGGTGALTCDSTTGEVLGLDLANNGLGGYLPTQLGQLTSLSAAVDLSDNIIASTIPTELGRFTALVGGFDLGKNSFAGPGGGTPGKSNTIPTQLGRLVLLASTFDLEANGLDSSLPTQIGRMTSMVKDLNLLKNALTASIPTQVTPPTRGRKTITDNKTAHRQHKRYHRLPTPTSRCSPPTHFSPPVNPRLDRDADDDGGGPAPRFEPADGQHPRTVGAAEPPH